MEERRGVRKATLMTMGTIVLLTAAVLLGIPIMVRMAVFLGDLKSSNRPVDKSDLIPPVPPRINLSYTATNSGQQTIGGWGEAGSTVYLTQNGQEGGNVVVSEGGEFRFDGILLDNGDNLFAAVAVDQANNRSQPSDEVVLFYSNKVPELTIDSPTDRQEIKGDSRTVDVAGSTKDGIRLTVNDRVIVVGSNGKFSSKFTLNEGENVLVFVATDKSGNQTRKELTVIATP